MLNAQPAVERGSIADFDLLAEALDDVLAYDDLANLPMQTMLRLEVAAGACGWDGEHDLFAWAVARVGTYRKSLNS